MYVNFNMVMEMNMTPNQLVTLVAIKQQKNEDNSEFLKKYGKEVDELLMGELIEAIKGKSKQETISKLRISKKGQAILDKIDSYKTDNKDFTMFEYLCNKYLDHDDKERKIGSKTKTVEYISWFVKESGINHYQLFYLVMHFLENNPYTKLLEYMFFNDNQYRYQSPKLKNSQLWIWYENNKLAIEHIWRQNKQCDFN